MNKDMQNNILIVLLVIGLSYIFTISNSALDPQMAFIFLALTLLIIYKQISNHNINRNLKNVVENFGENELDKIRQFLHNINRIPDDANVPDTDIAELKQTSTEIRGTLNQLIGKMDALNTSRDQSSTSYDRSDLIGVGQVQTLQNERLKDLEKKVAVAKKILNEKEMADVSRTYPKIPVYSSCIVSNAGGDYSVDEPINEDSEVVVNSTNVKGGSYSTTGKWNGMLDNKDGVSTMNNDDEDKSSESKKTDSVETSMVKFLENISKNGINLAIA